MDLALLPFFFLLVFHFIGLTSAFPNTASSESNPRLVIQTRTTTGDDCPSRDETKTNILFSAAFRATDLCEAPQQCGGVDGRERGVPLCGSRRPCSYCSVEERWFRLTKGKVRSNQQKTQKCFLILFMSFPVCLSLFCLKIWSRGGPYLNYSSGYVVWWGVLYMRGGEHGREVWSFCLAYSSWSVRHRFVIFLRFIIVFLLYTLKWWPPLILLLSCMITVKHSIPFYSIITSSILCFYSKIIYFCMAEWLVKMCDHIRK